MFCTHCGSETNQEEIVSHEKWYPRAGFIKSEKDGLADKEAYTVYQLTERVMRCKGCDRFHIFYTERTPANPEDHVVSYQVPRPMDRRQPEWMRHVNIDYLPLLGEIFHNYNNENYISFSIACRTLVDMFLTDLLGDIGGFERKVKVCVEKGNVTAAQASILEFLIEAGHASAHRGFSPTREISEAVLDTLEFLLRERVVSKKAAKYGPKIPTRRGS